MCMQKDLKQAQQRRHDAAESLKKLDQRLVKKRVAELLAADAAHAALQVEQKQLRQEIHYARLNSTLKQQKCQRLLEEIADVQFAVLENHSKELIASESLIENDGKLALMNERMTQIARAELGLPAPGVMLLPTAGQIPLPVAAVQIVSPIDLDGTAQGLLQLSTSQQKFASGEQNPYI